VSSAASICKKLTSVVYYALFSLNETSSPDLDSKVNLKSSFFVMSGTELIIFGKMPISFMTKVPISNIT
jgi:hypothetical protein